MPNQNQQRKKEFLTTAFEAIEVLVNEFDQDHLKPTLTHLKQEAQRINDGLPSLNVNNINVHEYEQVSHV